MNTNAKHIAMAALLFAGPLVGHAFATETCVTPSATIVDNGPLVVVPLDLQAAAGATVESVTLGLSLSHDWVGDLRIVLRSPSGTDITLIDRPGFSPSLPLGAFPGPFGCGGRDIDALFTQDATQPAQTQCSTTGQTVIIGPVLGLESLATLIGEPASGEWELRVQDLSPTDSGTIDEVCLNVETSQRCAADINNDGSATPADFTAWLGCFNDPASQPFCANADVNNSGAVDPADFTAWLAAFNAGCP